MSSVRSAAVSESGIWAATSGGAFFYNMNNKMYSSFSKSEGLSGASLTAAAVDKYGKVWFGSADGIINVYFPSTNSFKIVLDIFNSDRTAKQINQIIPAGDSIFIASDFGISVIDANNFLFYDTYFRFGDLSSNIKVNSIFISDIIYACTDFGIAVQKRGAVNLSAPESWDIYSTASGLPSNKIYKVLQFNGQILSATDRGIYVFDGNSWSSFLTEFNNTNVVDLSIKNNELLIMIPGTVFSFDGSSISVVIENPSLNNLLYSNQSGLLAYGNSGIIRINEDLSTEIIQPNGPQANQFPSLSVDKKGVLWSASGRDISGVGFYKLEEGTWTNYNTANNPELPSNFYHSVYTAPDNTKYFGNWGSGFARVKDDGSIDIFTTANTDMLGIPNDPQFLVVSNFAADSRNNLWILNFGAADRNTLCMLTPDSSWYFFTIPAANNFTLDQHSFLAIDQYDTKWFSTVDSRRMGLYYFNENKTFTNTSDDKSGYINSASGLNENTVTAIEVDRRGDIWVGTSLGVNVISNIGTIVSQPSPQLRISSVFTLRQQTINCIAVDPLNQKWVGTNQGLLLVNSDGSSLIASFDSKNSPLLSDVIRSIAIDEQTGRIYVGTDAGLTSFDTPSIKPEETFGELFLYPSPFILKNSGNLLTIDGLIRDTDIKILSASGKLVNEFSSPGGRTAFWNGTDLNGGIVNSGVYFVVAYDKEGNNVSTGKIAVLRE